MLHLFLSFLTASSIKAVSADNSNQCSSQNITSASDLGNIASCQNITGNLIFTSQYVQGTLSGVQRIVGDLRIEQNANAIQFMAPDLEEITGTLSLVNLTIFSALSMPKLTSVGTINIEIAPALESLGFTNGVTDCDSVLITDTGLSSLDGIELETCKMFNINNNFGIRNISIPSLYVVDGPVNIDFNAKTVYVEFPNLVTMQNGSFRQIGAISMPSLNNVTGSLGFFESALSQVILPNLTSTSESFSVVNNSQLTNCSTPNLKTIGGALFIANNTEYDNIQFNSVKTVGGAVDITGDFNNLSMTSLSQVKGGLNVQSSSQNFTCPFDNLRSSGAILGDSFVCTGRVVPQTGTNGTNITANTSTDTEKKSGASSNVITMGSFVFSGASVLAIAFSML